METRMPILGEFNARAHTELVGKAVILADGKAVRLERLAARDRIHGLRNLYPRN